MNTPISVAVRVSLVFLKVQIHFENVLRTGISYLNDK